VIVTGGRRHLVAATLAGVGAFVVDAWPALVVWYTANSGSIGQVDEDKLASIGLVFSLLFGVLVAWVMWYGLERSDRSPQLGRLDIWGAYALGLGVHTLVLVTLKPAATFTLLFTDEGDSLAGRQWRIYFIWLGTHAVAAGSGVAAGRALLGRYLMPSQRAGAEEPQPTAVRED
jgi:hypothetical protein